MNRKTATIKAKTTKCSKKKCTDEENQQFVRIYNESEKKFRTHLMKTEKEHTNETKKKNNAKIHQRIIIFRDIDSYRDRWCESERKKRSLWVRMSYTTATTCNKRKESANDGIMHRKLIQMAPNGRRVWAMNAKKGAWLNYFASWISFYTHCSYCPPVASGLYVWVSERTNKEEKRANEWEFKRGSLVRSFLLFLFNVFVLRA